MKARTHTAERSRRGFSLIESLVALAILSMAITVLTLAIHNTVTALESSPDRSKIESDLSFLRRYVLLAPDRETAEEGGQAETLSSGYGSWEVEIEPAEVLDLFKVSLTFRLEGEDSFDREEIVASEILWLLRPGWSLPEERDPLLEDRREVLRDRRSGVEWLGKEDF